MCDPCWKRWRRNGDPLMRQRRHWAAEDDAAIRACMDPTTTMLRLNTRAALAERFGVSPGAVSHRARTLRKQDRPANPRGV